MRTQNEHFIPALKYRWLTSLYDPVVRWTTRESAFKQLLIEQAGLAPHHSVLDLGCGTATLAIALKLRHPDAQIFGLDADSEILKIARTKANKAGVELVLEQGYAEDLPYPDVAFDRVLSSLFFHHLTTVGKLRALREIHRVLKPRGQFHVADWAESSNGLQRAAFLLVQLLDGFETTADNVKGRLPQIISEGGFQDVEETSMLATPLGTIRLYRAQKRV